MCCHWASPALYCLTDLWGKGETSIFLYSFLCICLCINVSPWLKFRKELLTSETPVVFSSSFDTQRSKSPGLRNPTTFCQRKLPMALLLPVVFTLLLACLMCVCACVCAHILQALHHLETHTSFSQPHTYETCHLLWDWGLLVSCLCEGLFKAFDLKWSCEQKRKAAWSSEDTRHFHSHYTVTHPLPAS